MPPSHPLESTAYRPLWQTRLTLLASLLLLLQRVPLIAQALVWRSSLWAPMASIVKFTTPIATGIGATMHSVTGATAIVPIAPSANPARATVGEEFTWVFRTTGEKAQDYSFSGLPPGIEDSGVVTSGISSITGTPSQPGEYSLAIVGWEHTNQRGDQTPTYRLTINVAEGTPPTILTQPQSIAVNPGADAALAVDAEGSHLDYLWRKDGDVVAAFDRVLVSSDASVAALVPTDDIGSAWREQLDFDDSLWLRGKGGVGYETAAANTYDPFIGVDTIAMDGTNATAYARIPFEVAEADLALLNDLKLHIRFDDGFVAYLNGVEMASANAPAQPSWNSRATSSNEDDAAVQFDVFDSFNVLSHLRAGTNLLAIHGMNSSTGSSDFLVHVKLIATRDTNRPALTLPNLQASEAGNYTVEIRNGSGSIVSDVAVVTVNTPGGFEAWQTSHFTQAELATPNVSARDADPDGDGLTNGVEYALGSSPLAASGNEQPAITLESIDEQAFAIFAFSRNPEAFDTGITVETTNTLEGPWTAASGEVLVEAIDARLTVKVPLSPMGRRFIRLRIGPQ